MEEGQDNSVGRLQLELILQKLLSRITDSLPHFPLYLRQLCHMLYEDMRYDHPDYIHRVLGNLIFLRFIVRCRPVNVGEQPPQAHLAFFFFALRSVRRCWCPRTTAWPRSTRTPRRTGR
jgi:hypothetical protein